MNSEKNSYEGRQDKIRSLELPEIETFENIYSGRRYTINIETGQSELSSICPKTGLPDFATLYIEYEPDEKCIELKSLKEYFGAYRNIGIFHEFLANKILEDLVKAVDPLSMKILIDMNPRGNVRTKVSSSFCHPLHECSITEEEFNHGI